MAIQNDENTSENQEKQNVVETTMP